MLILDDASTHKKTCFQVTPGYSVTESRLKDFTLQKQNECMCNSSHQTNLQAFLLMQPLVKTNIYPANHITPTQLGM